MAVTPKVMKIAALAFAVVIMSACTRYKNDYTCICWARSGYPPSSDSTFSLGHIPQRTADSQCAVHNDSIDSCYMLIERDSR
jgi:hypothetical protein